MDKTAEKLVSVFTVGEVVFIKHDAIIEPVLCIIEMVEDNNIYFRFPDIFIQKNILPGDYIFCQTLKENYEYVIYGEITDIEIKPPRFVCVAIDKYNKYKNNRVFARYCVNLQGAFSLPGDAKENYMIINNLSIIGAAMVTKEELEQDTIICLKIRTLLKEKDFLEFSAKVVRIIKKESLNEYGLEIINIDMENRDILDKVLFCLNSEEVLRIEELKKLE